MGTWFRKGRPTPQPGYAYERIGTGLQLRADRYSIMGCSSIFPSAEANMIRKLATGGYRLYSRKKNASTGKRRNLGTFRTREEAAAHERAVQYFKHH